MRQLSTILLGLTLSLFVFDTSNAQLQKDWSGTNDMANITIQEDSYNPWTVHKRIGQFGLLGSWASTVIGAAAMDDEMLETTLIPVAGPFVTLARVEGDEASEFQPGGRTLLILSGVTQTSFLVYMVVAWVGETGYAAQQSSGFSVMPTSDQNGTGVSLRYQF